MWVSLAGGLAQRRSPLLGSAVCSISPAALCSREFFQLSRRSEILGLWLEHNEGAKFWLRVMSEPKNRGVEHVLIAVVDGLKGFPEAITAVFPLATGQTCIVAENRGFST